MVVPSGLAFPSRSSGSTMSRSLPRSATAKWWCSVTGRWDSTTTFVVPRTEVSQAPKSEALLTVADRLTKVTPGGVSTRTSSHTEPR